MIECGFFIEIFAPKGLKGIERFISSCRMDLKPHLSGYNSKVILESSSEDEFEWDMDSSNTDIMVASGAFFKSVEESKNLLESLSYILAIAGFPNHWMLDDENENPKYSGQFKWNEDWSLSKNA